MAGAGDERRRRAEAILAEYLVSLERGDFDALLDFDGLVERNRDIADELRALYANWNDTVGLLEALESRRAGAASEAESAEPDPHEADVLHRLAHRDDAFDRYRVEDEVARGGQGAILRVWDSDLERDLAMKVMHTGSGRRGLDTRSARTKKLGRFLEEAQVTGQLDHPGIVPVHELGLDRRGRVYFTMKLVKGRDLRKIIALIHAGSEEWTQIRVLHVILKVCEAMAYAHSKGVVHRDLKPGNVMVGMFGEVYVMDWGLAKVPGENEHGDPSPPTNPPPAAGRLADREEAKSEESESSLRTQDGDVIGTPAYMAPEQAMGRMDEVGPAADVYAVGAMLYELLHGLAPYAEPDGSAPHNVVLLRIGEGPPPSLRDAHPELPSELVAICEKAMARDISDRYAGMKALGDDLRAFLEVRVVLAHESGAWAEARKWVRRNKSLAASLGAAALLLVGGLAAVSHVQARGLRAADAQRAIAESNAEIALNNAALAERRAEETAEQRRVAEAARVASENVTSFLVQQFEGLEPAATLGRSVGVHELLASAARDLARDAVEDPREAARLRQVVGNAYRSLGEYEVAEPLLERALEDRRQVLGEEHPDTLRSFNDLATLFRNQGRYDESEELCTLALASGEALEADHPVVTGTLSNLGALYVDQGRYEEAEALYMRALAGLRERGGTGDSGTLDLENSLAGLYHYQGRYDEAEALYKQALERLPTVYGEDHPLTLMARNNLAVLHVNQRRYEEADALFRVVLEQRRSVLGDAHPHTLSTLNNLGNLLKNQGKYDQAEQMHRDALEKLRVVLGDDHLRTLASQDNLAGVYRIMRRFDEAEQLYTQALEKRRARLGDDHPDTLASLNNLAGLHGQRGDYAKAEALYVEALERLPAILGEEHPNTIRLIANLEELYENWVRSLRWSADEGHPQLTAVLGRFAALSDRVGQVQRAEEFFLEALDRRLQQLGEDDPLTLDSFHALATFYARRGRADDAEPLLWECYGKRRELLGPSEAATLASLEWIVRLYDSERRWGEARSLVRELVSATPPESESLRARELLLERVLEYSGGE